MKKVVLYACIPLLLIGISMWTVVYFGRNGIGDKDIVKEENNSGMLNIYGNDITKENVTIHYIENASYADLPFTEVLKGLEFNVEWVDNNTANISYKDKKYLLDLTAVSLTEVGDDDNLIFPPVGGPCTRIVLDRELILDSTTIKSAIEDMDKNIYIKFDHAKLIVYITQIKD